MLGVTDTLLHLQSADWHRHCKAFKDMDLHLNRLHIQLLCEECCAVLEYSQPRREIIQIYASITPLSEVFFSKNCMEILQPASCANNFVHCGACTATLNYPAV